MIEAVSQHEICARHGSEYVPVELAQKVGIALDSLRTLPLNALRHSPEGGTCGWYIWGGETMSQDPDFFQPLHVAHLSDYCPDLIPFLALSPGWRVLLAPGQTEVWFDRDILSV